MTQVRLEREDRPVEHVAIKQVFLPSGATTLGLLDERDQERVDLIGEAVVRMERNADVISLCQGVDGVGERNGAEHRVFVVQAGRELPSAGTHLQKPVAAFGC